MPLDPSREQELVEVTEQLLSALSTIAQHARSKLADASETASSHVLAGGTNTMVDGSAAARKLGAVLASDRAQLERVTDKPFDARLVVEWQDQPGVSEILYVTRTSAAGLTDAAPMGKLVSYLAELGRLAALPAGETATIMVGGRAREARIAERMRLRPEHREGTWDGVDNKFEFSSWDIPLESLRAVLAQLRPALEEVGLLGALRRKAASEDLLRRTLRRKVIDRISLRDEPILDRYQDEIFRMPLDRQLLLLGPPGTGKTTTLIRRLAQKRTPHALTDDETQLVANAGLQSALAATDGWLMFSPTELLSLYLRDAFNREGVAAVDGQNLRTWDKERFDLARNVLGILRSSESGVFQLDEAADIIADGSSPGLSRVFDEFLTFVEHSVLEHTSAALIQLEHANDGTIGAPMRQLRRALGTRDHISIRDIVRLVDVAPEILQPEIKRLDEQIHAELDRSADRLLHRHRGLLDELSEALPQLSADGERLSDEEEEEEHENDSDTLSTSEDSRTRALAILEGTIRTAARAAAQARFRIGGRAGRVLKFLGERTPPPDDMLSLGELLLTRGRLHTLRQAPRRYVMGVPRLYAAFRNQAVREERLFRPDAAEAVQQRRISLAETDIVILTMLRNARLIGAEASPDWLGAIKSRYVAQVFVDEATDFSAVQLACTRELAHPRLRSWFACGDLLQRVTAHGLQDLSELKWIARGGSEIDIREVRFGYRQARRLRDLATGLANGQGAAAPEAEDNTNIWPLLAEHHVGEKLGAWLAERIVSVERAIGRLPSIAVFVDGEDRIDDLLVVTRPFLAAHNIPIVGCRDGRVVGHAQQVRVFDVRHIKGLEFEAVFFVGIDRLAQRLPDLFDRYLYVGITRAATYLGVTSDAALPTRLEHARQYFGEVTTHRW